MAVVPMPLEPPWISTLLAFRQACHLEEVGPDGEEGFRKGGGLHCIITLGEGQRLTGRQTAIFGITAAIGERADLVAELE